MSCFPNTHPFTLYPNLLLATELVVGEDVSGRYSAGGKTDSATGAIEVLDSSFPAQKRAARAGGGVQKEETSSKIQVTTPSGV